MATDSGYSNQKKKGIAQYETVQSLGSSKYGKAIVSKNLFEKTASSLIVSVTDIIGSNGQVEFWNIQLTTHGALVGDILRILASTLLNFEFEIMSVVDADNIRVLPVSDVKPTAGMSAEIYGWVSNKSDSSGAIITSSAPVKFVLDGVPTEVEEDTVTPANNRPLPVKLTGFTGDVTITANQLDVSTNSTEDSMSLGDFTTGLKATIDSNISTAKGELHVKDDDAVTKLTSIDGKLPSNLTVSSTRLLVDGSGVTQPISGTVTVSSLPSITGLVELKGTLDPNNSSTTALPGGGVFTGTAFDITNYACINVNVFSDVPSATNGLRVELSPDGTNWDHTHSTTYTAATGVGYIFNAEFRYARVVYTNGASAQATFRLQTIFKTTKVQGSLYTLSQSLSSNMFAELTRSVITGETTGGGGGFVNVKVTPSGALATESTVTGSVSVTNFPATQPISAASLPLPAGASTLAEQQTQTTAIGSLTETAPATDTASSGLNGRLQRIAQRLTSLIALFPSSIGQKTSSDSLSVVLSSDSAPLVSSGTITQVQKSVGITAVRATVSGSAPSAIRKRLLIKPSKNNTGSIYLGSSSVTTGTGLEIIGPDRLEFLLDSSDYYLISDTAAQVVEIVEVV